MKRHFLVLLPAALLACPGPEDPPPECDAQRACSADKVCEAGKCVVKQTQNGVCREQGGTVPNLLDNPGFECGSPPSAWNQGFFGELTTVAGRTGTQAGRFTSKGTPSDPQVRYVLTNAATAAASPESWVCGSAYVRGTGANAVMRLTHLGSNIKDDFAQPLTADWARLNHAAKMFSADTGAEFAVGLRGPVAGQYIEVDDAQLWISTEPDGGCTQR